MSQGEEAGERLLLRDDGAVFWGSPGVSGEGEIEADDCVCGLGNSRSDDVIYFLLW